MILIALTSSPSLSIFLQLWRQKTRVETRVERRSLVPVCFLLVMTSYDNDHDSSNSTSFLSQFLYTSRGGNHQEYKQEWSVGHWEGFQNGGLGQTYSKETLLWWYWCIPEVEYVVGSCPEKLSLQVPKAKLDMAETMIYRDLQEYWKLWR